MFDTFLICRCVHYCRNAIAIKINFLNGHYELKVTRHENRHLPFSLITSNCDEHCGIEQILRFQYIFYTFRIQALLIFVNRCKISVNELARSFAEDKLHLHNTQVYTYLEWKWRAIDLFKIARKGGTNTLKITDMEEAIEKRFGSRNWKLPRSPCFFYCRDKLK